MEHALELETPHLSFQRLRLALDIERNRRIILAFRELEQLRGIGDPFAGAVEIVDFVVQPGALAPELLRPLGLRPDFGVFELTADLLETLLLAVVFKETPEESRRAPPDL